MGECFCGCGRAVSFEKRWLNHQGRRTSELIERLEKVRLETERRGPLTDGGNIEPLLSTLDQRIAEGREFECFWRSCIHRLVLPPPSDPHEVKRDCASWVKQGSLAAELLELPPEDQLRVIHKV